jgi:hypothetical protein
MFLIINQDAIQYNECSTRHNALVDVIKEKEKNE